MNVKSYEEKLNDTKLQLCAPMVNANIKYVALHTGNLRPHFVSYDELVKYVRERELIANNETVRSLWDRYQVAVKLVGSRDHG